MTIPMQIFSVTQLNRHVRAVLEQDIGEVWVEGELSNLSKPTSGHAYFSLKDEQAQIRCVYFRNRHTHETPSMLENGRLLLARGTLSLYEARGDFQLLVTELKPSGFGYLYQQFEQLKKKLASMGLFNSEHKRPLPAFPNTIGVITSQSGAAIRDILITLKRRFPLAKIIVYQSEVQGSQAPQQLINALAKANADQRCEVLILARGGGSLEDLWAFNNEQLAYAISDSSIPLITGIGHETDFTIADFVADLRAATPTAAAMAATPDQQTILTQIATLLSSLKTNTTRLIQYQKITLDALIQTLTSPEKNILSFWQTLDYLQHRLHRSSGHMLAQKHHALHLILTRLQVTNPSINLQQSRTTLRHLNHRLHQHMMHCLYQHKEQLQQLMSTLHAVSPMATLDRGYALVTHNSHLITNSNEVQSGDIIEVQLAKGRLKSEVLLSTNSRYTVLK